MKDDEAAIHGKLTPGDGWVTDQTKLPSVALDELIGIVRTACPEHDLARLHWYLPRIFNDAAEKLRIGRPDDKKPATHVRASLDDIAKHASAFRQALEKVDPFVMRALTFELTRPGPDPASPSSFEEVRANLLGDLSALADLLTQAKPVTQSGADEVLSSIAGSVASLLTDVAGEKLRRGLDGVGGPDDYWSLTFFQKFMAAAEQELPAEKRRPPLANAPYSDVWRRACRAAAPTE